MPEVTHKLIGCVFYLPLSPALTHGAHTDACPIGDEQAPHSTPGHRVASPVERWRVANLSTPRADHIGACTFRAFESRQIVHLHRSLFVGIGFPGFPFRSHRAYSANSDNLIRCRSSSGIAAARWWTIPCVRVIEQGLVIPQCSKDMFDLGDRARRRQVRPRR